MRKYTRRQLKFYMQVRGAKHINKIFKKFWTSYMLDAPMRIHYPTKQYGLGRLSSQEIQKKAKPAGRFKRLLQWIKNKLRRTI